jgi:ABC-type multidrug transport system ATPase subunit
LELAFRNLDYTVTLDKRAQKREGAKEKKILSGLTGRFQAGRLTAVMGSSGAGKTTLLSILAGTTKGGTISGDIQVNGEPYTGRGLKEISGFVFQDDVLLPTMTVKEAIHMSALLRTPKSVDRDERNRRISDIIDILHLDHAKDTQVGSPLQKGISGGERKRTAIGMEMVVNPPMLFLDEPTTGLDTFTAFTVILSLQRLARMGRTVVATIHQPSTEIFNLFDDLLIMSRGRVSYFGPADKVIEYFDRQGYPCPQYSNPADYIFMEVLREFGSVAEDEDVEEEEHDAVQEMQQIDDASTSLQVPIVPTSARSAESELQAAGTGQTEATRPRPRPPPSPPVSQKTPQEICDERIEGLLSAWLASAEYDKMSKQCDNPEVKGVALSSLRKKAPFWTQFKYLFARAGKNFIRNRMLLATRLFQAIFLGVIIGLVFLDANQYSVEIQIRNKAGALYFIAVNNFFSASTQILSIFGVEKPVFYREYLGGYYSVAAYYISKTIIEIPGQIIGPYLMVIICYYMIGLNPPFSDYLLVATLAAFSALCGNTYGTLIVACVDDLGIALTIAPLCILPLLVVSGIFVAALPVYINWLKYISPIYYAFSGMIQTEFSRTFPNCDPTAEVCNGSRAIEELNFAATFPPGVDIVFLATIFAVLWVLGFIALYIGAKRKQ